MKSQSIALCAIIAIIFGAGGFFGGMTYAQNRRPSFQGQFNRGNGTTTMRLGGSNGQNGGSSRLGFRPVMGEISAMDDTTVTVKMADGSSKIVVVSGSTTINKSQEAQKSDLTTGTTISAFGTENADGSVNAQNIQIGTGLGARMMGNPTAQ